MTNLPAIPSISGPPKPLDRNLSLTIAAMHSSVAVGQDGKSKMLDASRVPGPNLTRILQQRRDLIQGSLNHRDVGSVRVALQTVFAVTKGNREDRADPEDMADIYGAVLSDLPSWAVVQACFAICRGHGTSDTFTPAAPEIHRGADLIVAKYRHELSQIEAILTASGKNDPSEATRKKISTGLQQLSTLIAGVIESASPEQNR